MDDKMTDEEKKRRDRLQFIEAANEEYAALRRDPAAWDEELKERALWDRTLMDGQDD